MHSLSRRNNSAGPATGVMHADLRPRVVHLNGYDDETQRLFVLYHSAVSISDCRKATDLNACHNLPEAYQTARTMFDRLKSRLLQGQTDEQI